MMKKMMLWAGAALLMNFAAFAQLEEPVQVTYNGGRNYSLVERTDLRRYDNNKYVGLVSREVRSFIVNDGDLYDGSFYVDEGTRHQNMSVGSDIHDSIPSTFRITPEGQLIMLEDNGYPSFRSFPAFPKEKIKKGDSWTGSAMRSVDPLNKGIPTKMPMEVLYTYTGDEVVRGEPVYVFSAKWATRYGISYFDFGGDQDLKSANGSHSATMYVSKVTGYAMVVRDSVNENFIYRDGSTVSLRGTISLFTEYPPAVDRTKVIQSLQRVAMISAEDAKELTKPVNESRPVFTSDIKVENTTAGLRLTIQNLQFKANSSELLPGEDKRLDQIAAVLKEAGNNQFLVEGHTADTGFEKGEMQLSAERAKTIAAALAKRGISSGKFITKGSGAHKPIADNSTPEGKALNRRVEITILE